MDEDYVKVRVDLKNSVYDEIILPNVLWKNLQVVQNHILSPFMIEQVEVFWLSQSLVYSLVCHSLLNLCFQNGQSVESAWCLSLQFKHLKECRQGTSFLVSNLGGLILSLALQHYTNWRWWMDWWRMLHLTHLNLWILYTPAVWPYFQQFLHCSTPEFMCAPWIVAMKLPMLNLLLMRLLALILLCISHISIHTMDMSDLGETLITFGLEVRMMLLKMWLFFRIFSISSKDKQEFDCSER